jgi:PilZ domain
MAEHRNQPRQAAMVRVQVSWKDESGQSHEASAILDDTSRGGVGILIAEPVPVGAILEIKSHRGPFSGTVVHCKPRQNKFLLGVQRNT